MRDVGNEAVDSSSSIGMGKGPVGGEGAAIDYDAELSVGLSESGAL